MFHCLGSRVVMGRCQLVHKFLALAPSLMWFVGPVSS